MKKLNLIMVCLLASVVLFFGCLGDESKDNNSVLIGGERDNQGCLGPAGYSFDGNVGACLRNWELNDAQKEVARMAVLYKGFEKGLTVVEVLKTDCANCFKVKLELNQNFYDIEINNFQIENTNRVYCTAQSKKAEICTLEYSPVMGDDGKEYSNACFACSSGQIDYYLLNNISEPIVLPD
jgi:hypothetical protein